MSCEIKRLKDIRVMPIAVFDAGGGELSALIELRNPNANYGADFFSYKVVFYDADGADVYELVKDSFIYPGEIKFLIEAGLPVTPSRVLRAEAKLKDISWRSINEFSLPKAQARDVRIENKTSGKGVVVGAVIVNRESFGLSRVGVGVILENDLGIKLGVSETALDALEPFEERSVSITVPNVDYAAVDLHKARVVLEPNR